MNEKNNSSSLFIHLLLIYFFYVHILHVQGYDVIVHNVQVKAWLHMQEIEKS